MGYSQGTHTSIQVTQGDKRLELWLHKSYVLVHYHVITDSDISSGFSFKRKFWDSYYYSFEAIIPSFMLKRIFENPDFVHLLMGHIGMKDSTEDVLTTLRNLRQDINSAGSGVNVGDKYNTLRVLEEMDQKLLSLSKEIINNQPITVRDGNN